jgi:hypothetical protein
MPHRPADDAVVVGHPVRPQFDIPDGRDEAGLARLATPIFCS